MWRRVHRWRIPLSVSNHKPARRVVIEHMREYDYLVLADAATRPPLLCSNDGRSLLTRNYSNVSIPHRRQSSPDHGHRCFLRMEWVL